MLELIQPQIASERPKRRPEGLSTLHAACATVARTSPDMIRSIHVTVPVADLAVPTSSAVDLAERIAAENGMIAQAQIRNQLLTVRLVRAPREG
jgi:hypothetical protein